MLGGKDKPKTPTVGNRQPILSHIANAAEPDPTLAGVSVVVPPPQVNTEWAQAGGIGQQGDRQPRAGGQPDSRMDRLDPRHEQA